MQNSPLLPNPEAAIDVKGPWSTWLVVKQNLITSARRFIQS